jgi:hypothetical protein
MENSVRLSDLPYTGFDYGEPYNSIFWLLLLVWSFFMSRLIIKLSGRKVVQVSQRRQERREQQLSAEIARGPQILEERVIRYKDPVDSAPLQPVAPPYTPPEIEHKVATIVEQELAVTRAGESDDEFDDGDFERVDFDGVNPDVYWRPREQQTMPATSSAEREYTPEQVTYAESKQTASSVHETINPPQESPRVQKVYKDTLILDKLGEYPRMMLKREEVSA